MSATNAPSQPTDVKAEQKAHEQSMDDILASIRRIIADDETLPLSRAAKAATTAAAPAPTPAPAAAPSADAFFGLGQRLERGVQSETPKIVTETPQARTPTLKLRDFAPKETDKPAETAAEATATAGKAAARAENEAGAEKVGLRPSLTEAETPVASPPSSPTVASLAEARMKAASAVFRAPVVAVASPAPVAPEPDAAEIAAEAEKPRQEVSAPALRAAPPPQEKSESPLLSQASGAKIGASFDALAQSLLLRDPDMIERLAREMLRPMLKAWLDDNLPIVVERLVRAEIERVARGPA